MATNTPCRTNESFVSLSLSVLGAASRVGSPKRFIATMRSIGMSVASRADASADTSTGRGSGPTMKNRNIHHNVAMNPRTTTTNAATLRILLFKSLGMSTTLLPLLVSLNAAKSYHSNQVSMP